MGSDATAILAYGYDVGQTFGHDYDTPHPAWYQDGNGWRHSAERALLAAVGFTEEWTPDSDGYFDRKKNAEQQVGVHFERQGSDSDVYYLMAAKSQRVEWGDVEAVDMTLPDNADERLAWALDVLGVKPTDDKPGWLLAAYYG